MARTKIVVHDGAVEALLKSRGVEAELLTHARRISSTAGPGMLASSEIGRTRARAIVVTATPEAMLAEAYHRRLSSALGAGRG